MKFVFAVMFLSLWTTLAFAASATQPRPDAERVDVEKVVQAICTETQPMFRANIANIADPKAQVKKDAEKICERWVGQPVKVKINLVQVIDGESILGWATWKPPVEYTPDEAEHLKTYTELGKQIIRTRARQRIGNSIVSILTSDTARFKRGDIAECEGFISYARWSFKIDNATKMLYADCSLKITPTGEIKKNSGTMSFATSQPATTPTTRPAMPPSPPGSIIMR